MLNTKFEVSSLVALMMSALLVCSTRAQTVTPPPSTAPATVLPPNMRAAPAQPVQAAGLAAGSNAAAAGSDFVAPRRTQPVNPFTGHAARRDELYQQAELLEAELKVANLSKAISEARGRPSGTLVPTARAIPSELPRLSAARAASSSRRDSAAVARTPNRSTLAQPEPATVSATAIAAAPVTSLRTGANYPRLAAVLNQGTHLEALVEVGPGRFEQFKDSEARDGLKLDSLTTTSAVLNGKRHRLRTENATVAEASGALVASLVQSAPVATPPLARSQPIAGFTGGQGISRPTMPGVDSGGLPTPGLPIMSQSSGQ